MSYPLSQVFLVPHLSGSDPLAAFVLFRNTTQRLKSASCGVEEGSDAWSLTGPTQILSPPRLLRSVVNCATKKQEKAEQSMLSLTHMARAGRSYCNVQIKHSPQCRQELHSWRIIYCFKSLLIVNFYICCYEGSIHQVSAVLQLLTCKDAS